MTDLVADDGRIAGDKDLGQDVLELPRDLCRVEQLVEHLDHAFIIVAGLAIDGEHARGFANAQHLLPCQFPMDIAGQRR